MIIIKCNKDNDDDGRMMTIKRTATIIIKILIVMTMIIVFIYGDDGDVNDNNDNDNSTTNNCKFIYHIRPMERINLGPACFNLGLVYRESAAIFQSLM